MKNRLKIAILSIHSSPLGSLGAKDTGGMSTYLAGLSAALSRAGQLVDIFTRTGESTGENHIVMMHSEVRLIEIGDNFGPLDKYELEKRLTEITMKIEDFWRYEKMQYDLIFSHYWLSGLVGRALQNKWSLPHVLMFHTLGRAKNELCPGENEPLNRLKAEMELAESADLLVAASKAEKERLLSYYKLEQDRVELLPPGIDRSLFQPLDRNKARSELGLGPEKIIFAVGRLEPVKGFELLLEAVALIKPDFDYKVVIAGGDEQGIALKEELKSLAQLRGIADRIIFAGRVAHDRLPLYYNAASLTVIPSWYESFGLVALESLACHTPILAGPVGVIPELAEVSGSESCIYLVRKRKPALWAKTIEQALSAAEQSKVIDCSDLIAPFDWDLTARRLVSTFQRLKKNTL